MCCDSEAKNPDNWRLYHLLGLEQPVTAKQVQWTFRKVTLRHHFYQAYLVLSDTDRKSLYDALGEDAVGFIHSGSWGPLLHLLGSKAAIGFYFGSTVLAFLALLLFFIFLGVRVDDHVAWSWTAVAAPLFVLVIVALLITAFAAIVSLFWRPTWEEGMHYVDRIPAVCNFIAVVCYTIFCFLVVSAVGNGHVDSSGKFAAYFSLPIIADVVYYLSSLVWRWPRRIRLQMEIGLNKPSCFLCYGFFFLGIIYPCISIAQWLLIGRRIDRNIESSWYVVFIPFCFRAAFRVLEAYMRSKMKWTIGVKTVMGITFDTLGAFFFNGMLLVSLYFVAVRITRGKEEVQMPLALIPVYAALLYLLCAMFFTVVYLWGKNADNEREERLNNLKWIPTELSKDRQGGPMLVRDFHRGADDASWNDIEEDNGSSLVFHGRDGEGTEQYDYFESVTDEDLLDEHHGDEAPNTPYGVSAPLDEDVGPHFGSHTPTATDSEMAIRPRGGPVHHDPLNLERHGAELDSTESDNGEEEEYDEEYTDDDDRIGTLMSSSPTSSAFFTSSNHSAGR
ncbi:hypothetical protein TCSYLVIO_004670 [Trypanosoma cruzi]|uniref:Flagellum attachment zone protein 5 n=1 Tax=Trypanosoma cruzi TaxID=5693 RepID=A0A2V2VR42_TRYCR|nr:hypothetical protein TCSYLVIO_004670 [Trypanosoma cruzi]PBJ75461.1 hypothetical protein BCY84_11289 [Trypanosoma cruzi cruzi]PWU97718.1 Flagellum attachment zone protein 5 [Trypanosoma cruzi]RNF16196.1 hypothetical protein TcG_06543 [Trypanosoma cruzi]